MIDYYNKYKKYKGKYLVLKNKQNQLGGFPRRNDKTKIVPPPSNLIKIFPQYNNVDLNKITFTNESLYSVSKIKGALFTIDKIKEHYGSNKLTITDGTSNIGSDTIQFGIHFEKVNAIEYNKINYIALKKNVELYKLDNITVINGDINDKINNLTQDVIYIDAPWGGKKYNENQNVRLYLSKTEISNFVSKNIENNKAKLIVLKVPYNYDLNYFYKNVNKKNVHIYPFIRKEIIKYYIIIIDNKETDNIDINKDNININININKDN